MPGWSRSFVALVGAIAALAAFAPSSRAHFDQPTPSAPKSETRAFFDLNLIGGVKLVITTMDAMEKWERVRQDLLADTTAADEKAGPWTDWAKNLSSLSPKERLMAINVRVNQRLTYKIDQLQWGVSDYWQTPSESIALGTGDCEDYAILKAYLALKAGFTLDNLAVLTGVLAPNNQAHAVLVARDGNVFYVLDNRSPLVMTVDGRSDIKPLFSVTTNDVWLYRKTGGP